MKKNHEQVAALIHKAIAACSYHDSLAETKRLLLAALESTTKVAKKRTRLEQNRIQMEEAAKKKTAEWWEMIRNNMTKGKTDDLGGTPDDPELGLGK